MRKTLTSLICAGGATLPAFAHHEDIPQNDGHLFGALIAIGAVALIGGLVYFALKSRKSA